MKTKLYTFFFSTVLGLCSCSGFLDENNQSGLTVDPFFTTKVGLESSLNACYSGTRVWFGQENGFALTETGTDLFLRGGDNKANQIADYTIDLNGAQTHLKDYWAALYKALNACNTTISVLPSSVLTDAQNISYEGQAKFLRALYLWLITETWGDVVLNTEPVVGAVTVAHRSSADDFYKIIMDDLGVAITHLPVGKSTDGVITQDVAKAFKARMCLTRASETNDVALYAEAAALAEELIGSTKYSLFDNYKKLWDIENGEGGTNSEVIYYVNYTNSDIINGDFTVDTGYGHRGIVDFVMKYDKEAGMVRDELNGRPFQRFMPSLRLLDLYDETIDQRYEGTFKTVWIANKPGLKPGGEKSFPLMAEGDTAICTLKSKATVALRERAANRYSLLDRENMYMENGAPLNRSQYIEMHKFADPLAVYNQDWSQRDAFVIRIAEMYLIAAEALLHSNPDGAVGYINTLRQKRALPGKEEAMKVTAAQLNIDFILDERARELAGEQHRWFDLKRTGKLVEYVKKFNPDAKDNIQPYHTIRPIPQIQLDAVSNKGEFKQNPGYSK